VVARAVGWLARQQNADGGWPEQPGGPSAVAATTRTVWALLAVTGREAAGNVQVAASIERGSRWLAASLLPAGRPGEQAATAGHGDCCELAGCLTRLSALSACLRAGRTTVAGAR
jgi:hypothetical protein